MNQDHDKERIKDDGRCELPAQEDDWLDTSKACNLDYPECEACQ